MCQKVFMCEKLSTEFMHKRFLKTNLYAEIMLVGKASFCPERIRFIATSQIPAPWRICPVSHFVFRFKVKAQ